MVVVAAAAADVFIVVVVVIVILLYLALYWHAVPNFIYASSFLPPYS